MKKISKKLKKLIFFSKFKKVLILLSNLHFFTILTQYEHTTYDYVLTFLYLVLEKRMFVLEKKYIL